MFRMLIPVSRYTKFYLKKLVQLQIFGICLFCFVIISIIIFLPKAIQNEHVMLRWNSNVEAWFISRPNMTEIIKPNTKTCIHCLDMPEICKPNNLPLDVVYFVASHPRNFFKRQAIRNTWGNNRFLALKPIFMLAISSDAEIMKTIYAEAINFGDIILENFHDTYTNLTVKTGFILKHFLNLCPNAKYLMKTDDDTFVNTKTIQRILNKHIKYQPAFLGQTFHYARSTRDPHSKWYMSVDTYDHYFLPIYLSGSGYLISGKVVEALLQASLKEPIIRLEDVYFTGILANNLKLGRVHINKFFCDSPFCSPREYATVHKMKESDFYHVKR